MRVFLRYRSPLCSVSEMDLTATVRQIPASTHPVDNVYGPDRYDPQLLLGHTDRQILSILWYDVLSRSDAARIRRTCDGSLSVDP